jgi:hypothetical protein
VSERGVVTRRGVSAEDAARSVRTQKFAAACERRATRREYALVCACRAGEIVLVYLPVSPKFMEGLWWAPSNRRLKTVSDTASPTGVCLPRCSCSLSTAPNAISRVDVSRLFLRRPRAAITSCRRTLPAALRRRRRYLSSGLYAASLTHPATRDNSFASPLFRRPRTVRYFRTCVGRVSDERRRRTLRSSPLPRRLQKRWRRLPGGSNIRRARKPPVPARARARCRTCQCLPNKTFCLPPFSSFLLLLRRLTHKPFPYFGGVVLQLAADVVPAPPPVERVAAKQRKAALATPVATVAGGSSARRARARPRPPKICQKYLCQKCAKNIPKYAKLNASPPGTRTGTGGPHPATMAMRSHMEAPLLGLARQHSTLATGVDFATITMRGDCDEYKVGRCRLTLSNSR